MGAVPPSALQRARSREHLVDRLALRLPRVGVAGVLEDLDRIGARVPVPGEAAGDGFTWDEHDRQDPAWWPQGVVALRSGELLLVSWYARRDRVFSTPGARLSVVDRTHPDAPRYRHVRLVAPRRWPGGPRTGAVAVHAGGIAVVGDLLYVADTLSGVRLFRLGDVLRVPGAAGSGVSEYVLPQLGALRVPLRAGLRRLRFSFLSSGVAGGGTGGGAGGQASLVVGEYRRARDRPPRLARYALDPRTGLPVCDRHGRAVPVELHDDQPRRMQGAAVHGSTWFLTASAGPGTGGDLYVGAPGSWQRHRGVLPTGPEDLAWSLPGDELWCVSEWPGRRWVYPIATRPWLPGQEGSSRAA